MPRFVLLEHDHPDLHWDFMLEWSEVLLTWRLSKIPSERADIPATRLPDHRRIYLDYEGPVSGNRGTVQRVDAGQYDLLENEPGCVKVTLTGGVVCGTATLIDRGADKWVCHWQPAEPGGIAGAVSGGAPDSST